MKYFFAILCISNFAIAADQADSSLGEQSGVVTFVQSDASLYLPQTNRTKGPANSKNVMYEGQKYFEVAAHPGDRVEVGTRLHTSSSGKLRFVYLNGDQVSLGPASSLVVEKRSDKKNSATIVNLFYGKIRAVVKKTEGTEETRFTVKSATAVAGVRGTDFIFENIPGETPTLTVLRGSVALNSEKISEPKIVDAGFTAQLDENQKSGKINTEKTSREHLVDIQKFSHVPNQKKYLEALPPEQSARVIKIEKTAAEIILKDIQKSDPDLYKSLVVKNELLSSSELNSATVSKEIQTAPSQLPKSKKLQNELRELDNGIYEKYFKQE